MRRLRKREPEWKTLFPDVRVRFAPVSLIAWHAAKEAGRVALMRAMQAGADEKTAEFAGGEAVSRSLISSGILEWEGIGDADGNPIDPTRDAPELDGDGNPVIGDDGLPIVTEGTISLFLDDPRNFDAADEAYVMPFVAEHAEGNASAGSPDGISAVATPADDTASSVAPLGSESGAGNAPIGGTPRAPKRGKRSGK